MGGICYFVYVGIESILIMDVNMKTFERLMMGSVDYVIVCQKRKKLAVVDYYAIIYQKRV
jgi:hypothetical protein